MPKFVCNGPIPKSSLRYICHANYDRLPILTKQAQTEDCDINLLSDEFSDILRDVHINGFSKRTNPNRLKETERVLTQCIATDNRFRSKKPIHLLEVGGSDGVTTYELVNAVQEVVSGPVTAVIGDRYFDMIRYHWGPFTEYRTPNQEPILARVGRMAVRLPQSGSRWAIHTNLVAGAYMNLASLRKAMQADERITFVNPQVLGDERISTTELNIMQYNQRLKNQFDIVRVCNLLNWDYFSESELKEGIANCTAYLKDDGYLLISRNTNEEGGQIERGNLWHKKESKLTLIDEFGGGSEIKSLVTNYKVAHR